MCIHIYIYIYMHICMYMYLYISLSIYIYIYMCLFQGTNLLRLCSSRSGGLALSPLVLTLLG